MTKPVVKFFRDPSQAEKALSELKKHGFKLAELGILLSEKSNVETFIKSAHSVSKGVTIGEFGNLIATGPASDALAKVKDGDSAAALAELWGTSEDVVKYYGLGVFIGGVVISVHADASRQAKAKELIRVTSLERIRRTPAQANTPGFAQTERMSATNPVDAAMTGDFRKY